MNKKLTIFLSSLLLLVGVTSCKEKLTDYVAQTKLTQEYEGKSYFKDGIEEVTLNSCIDGDTAHFNLKSSGTLVKARFLGVDTPESTGAIEPYGKKAANFTCKLLTEASKNKKPIVLQSEGSIPEADSTGERYMNWIWADGKLINLALVQEGYSAAIGYVHTQYESVFYKADRQANDHKLNIWSGKKDESFNYGDYILTDLEKINLNKKDWIGQKVVFNAIVTRKNANNCYVQQEFTNDDGSVSTYGLYVFGSYNGYLDYVFVPGNYVKFYGIITEYLGNLQLTDVKYDPNWPGEHDVEVLEENRPYTTKVMTISEIKDTPYTNILVRLENVVFEPEGSYKNDKGMSIRVKDDTNNVITIRAGKGLYFTDENGKEIEDVNYFATKGKMTFTGNITFFKAEEDTGPGANQIDLSSMDDVTYEKK